MTEPTNDERANRIPPALLAYEEAKGDGNGIPDETSIRDLLADLMHYCRKNDLNFNQELRFAAENFEIEVNEEEHG